MIAGLTQNYIKKNTTDNFDKIIHFD